MPKPKFTYGDVLRKTSGGPLRTVQDIGATAYYFSDGTFALIEDQDCYTVVIQATGFFRVADSLDAAPLDDHLRHGYERRADFLHALRRLLNYWGGRVGERIDERNKFLRLRFHDTPGGLPDEAWLPLFLLSPAPIPDYMQDDTDETEAELDRAFGFD